MAAFLAPVLGAVARTAATSLSRQLVQGAISHTASHLLGNRQPQDPNQPRYA